MSDGYCKPHWIYCCPECWPVQTAKEKLAGWMMAKSYATGHGDSMESLLAELEWQLDEKFDQLRADLAAARADNVALKDQAVKFEAAALEWTYKFQQSERELAEAKGLLRRCLPHYLAFNDEIKAFLKSTPEGHYPIGGGGSVAGAPCSLRCRCGVEVKGRNETETNRLFSAHQQRPEGEQQ